MATPAQVEASRANGKKSRGPVTETGKQASCMNNFRHGLTGGRFYFIEGENPEHYDQLFQALESEHNPQTATEFILVEKMAHAQWLSQRALDMHTSTAAFASPYEVVDDINKWARYQAQHDHAFFKALNQLVKLRVAMTRRATSEEMEAVASPHQLATTLDEIEAKKQELGFESEKRAQVKQEREEAQEKHRETQRETRRQHDHLKTEILKQRLEREKSNAMVAGLRSAKVMERELGPEFMREMVKQAA